MLSLYHRIEAGLLAADLQAMLDLPRQSSDARRATQPATNSLALVKFDANRYGVT